MKSDAVAKVFRTQVNGYLAIHLEIALERLAKAGLELLGREAIRERSKEVLLNALENKSVLVIRGILRTLNPEVTENIREIDERKIWRVFWDLRNSPVNDDISIFAILAELNNNPPLIAEPV